MNISETVDKISIITTRINRERMKGYGQRASTESGKCNTKFSVYWNKSLTY